MRVAVLAGLICVTTLMGQPIPQPLQPGQIPVPAGKFPPQIPDLPGPPLGEFYGDPSHSPIGGSVYLPDLRSLLTKKNSSLIDPKLIEQLTKNQKLDRPQNLEELRKRFPQLDDPAFREKLKQWMDTPDGQKQIAEILKKQTGQADLDPKEITRDLKKLVDDPQLRQLDTKQKDSKDVKDPKDPKEDDASKDSKGMDPFDPKVDRPKQIEIPKKLDGSPLGEGSLDRPWTEEEKRRQEMIKSLEKFIGNSPAAQEAIKNFAESLAKGNFDKELAKMFEGQDWTDLKTWSKNNLNDINLKTPPDLGKGGGNSSWQFKGLGDFGGSGGGATSEGPSLDSFGGVGTTLLLLLGGLGGALIGWLLWNRRKEALAALAKAKALKGKRLLDWNQIQDRGSLVQAVDSVTLEIAGEQARHWHHQEVGKNLQAETLAELYAKARYLPMGEDLSPEEYSQARADLKSLAQGPKE